MDNEMIDATSGGALMDKTLATTRQLIENMPPTTSSSIPGATLKESMR